VVAKLYCGPCPRQPWQEARRFGIFEGERAPTSNDSALPIVLSKPAVVRKRRRSRPCRLLQQAFRPIQLRLVEQALGRWPAARRKVA